jgi:hypothetical protein
MPAVKTISSANAGIAQSRLALIGWSLITWTTA